MNRDSNNRIFKTLLKSSGVCIDSRLIVSNQIFFAFDGQFTKGSMYVNAALEDGAILAVVEGDESQSTKSIVYVVDVLLSLQELAIEYRQLFDIPVLGLTGSNGKTTTKELLNKVLSTDYKTHCTKGNYNNHIGVPLTILSMPRDTEFAVIEMGANHQKEISELCKIAQPNCGYITNIGSAHLEGFGDIEGVLKAKLELFDYLELNNGLIFLNIEDELLNRSKNLYQKALLVNDFDKENSWKIRSNQKVPFLTFTLQYGELILKCETSLIGEYNLKNISASIFIAHYFGIGLEDILTAISCYQSSNNRSSLLEAKGHHFIMDAYNANPSSMNAAIDNFMQMKVENKVLIIGDMLELGDESHDAHQLIIDYLSLYEWNHVILVGQHFSKCKTYNYNVSINVEHAIEQFANLKLTPSWILLKGSRGIQLENLVK